MGRRRRPIDGRWIGQKDSYVAYRRPSQLARRAGPRERLVASWSGMRGAVSLAAALALPLETSTGQGFRSGT